MKKNGVNFSPKIVIDPRDELWRICEKFIIENGIGCSESIYQSDRVILGAQNFIEEICGVVGYAKFEEEE